MDIDQTQYVQTVQGKDYLRFYEGQLVRWTECEGVWSVVSDWRPGSLLSNGERGSCVTIKSWPPSRSWEMPTDAYTNELTLLAEQEVILLAVANGSAD